MGWLLVDNYILSHEQPQKKLTGQKGRKDRGKRRGESLDWAESVLRSVKRRWQDSFSQCKQYLETGRNSKGKRELRTCNKAVIIRSLPGLGLRREVP